MTALRSTQPTRLLALTLAAAVGMTSLAAGEKGRDDRRGEPIVYTVDPSVPFNCTEGIAYDEGSQAFFVGGIADGAIYRGTLDKPQVTVFIPGQAGRSANGMKAVEGKLYVAGGFTGGIWVYDLATRRTVASFGGFGAGMLNDLVVTQKGDVYITDSKVANLWHITAAQVAAGGGVPDSIPVGNDIPYAYGESDFNLNGIAALKGGKSLIAAHTGNGKLYRIDLDNGGSHAREIRPIDVEPLLGADGILLDGADLLVVQGGVPGTLNVVRLDGKLERGQIIERRQNALLHDSSGVARARALYLVVNFDLFTGILPYTVVGLPRNFGDNE